MKKFQPQRRDISLSIAIPASLVDDVSHLRDKTFRIGLIGRAASIFRVSEIIIFRDSFKEDQETLSRIFRRQASISGIPA